MNKQLQLEKSQENECFVDRHKVIGLGSIMPSNMNILGHFLISHQKEGKAWAIAILLKEIDIDMSTQIQ